MRAVTHDGDEVRATRVARGWSQRQLAQRAGIGQRTLGRIERGETVETPKLRRVQAYLRIGPYWTGEPADDTWDPPLSKATAGEFGAELMRRLTLLERMLAEHGPDGADSGHTVRDSLAKPGVVTLTDDALDDDAHDDGAGHADSMG